VGVVHSPRHRGHQPRRGTVVGRQPRRLRRQAAPLDQLHREVVLALVLADLVDRDDVRMVEVGGRLRLGVKALHVGGGGQLAGQDHLERHEPVQAPLAGLVNDAHATAGDLFQQLVVAEVADSTQRRGARCFAGTQSGGQGRAWGRGCDVGIRRRCFEEAADLRVRSEQALHPAAQVGVAGARLVQVTGECLGRSLFQRGEEDRVGRGSFSHGRAPWNLDHRAGTCSTPTRSASEEARPRWRFGLVCCRIAHIHLVASPTPCEKSVRTPSRGR
jgi:hypothetical protein